MMSLPNRIPWLNQPWPNTLDWLDSKSEELTRRREHWKKYLAIKPDHRLIGLHWEANPKHEDSLYSRNRSIPLKAWESLLKGKKKCVEYIALQKGEGLKQWSRSSGLPYITGQEKFNGNLSLLDSSAVIGMCDTVISNDSYIVHLAGSLGVDTWVGLNHTPDWRWGLHKQRTPWYPTIKLFRQTAADDWGSVIQKMAKYLK